MLLYLHIHPLEIRFMNGGQIDPSYSYIFRRNTTSKHNMMWSQETVNSTDSLAMLYLHPTESWNKRWAFGHWKTPVVVVETVI